MFTKIVKSSDFDRAFDLVNKLTRKFEENNIKIARIKGEIISEDSKYFQVSKNHDFKPYYEWHCKIIIGSITDIIGLCHKYDAHLSINALDEDSRYITIREYDSELLFYQKVEKFNEILIKQDVTILKQKFEYCIYDSSLELDKGWAY